MSNGKCEIFRNKRKDGCNKEVSLRCLWKKLTFSMHWIYDSHLLPPIVYINHFLLNMINGSLGFKTKCFNTVLQRNATVATGNSCFTGRNLWSRSEVASGGTFGLRFGTLELWKPKRNRPKRKGNLQILRGILELYLFGCWFVVGCGCCCCFFWGSRGVC